MLGFFKTLLLTLGLGYLLILLYVYFNQTQLLHLPDLPSRKLTATPADMGLDYEPVSLTTDDGIRLQGWYLPASQPRATLLFFHGNAGNISHRLNSLALFHRLGLAVFIFDYRGYGESQGEPTEAGIYRDAETAWRYLTENRKTPADEILLFGRSFGGAVAAYLAQRHEALGLILESTFTSVPEMAEALYPWLPVRLLSRFRYDSLQRLPQIGMPVMVMHSVEDELIPYAQARRLFEAAREPKQFLSLNGGHNQGFIEDQAVYRNGLDRFIRLCLQTKASNRIGAPAGADESRTIR